MNENKEFEHEIDPDLLAEIEEWEKAEHDEPAEYYFSNPDPYLKPQPLPPDHPRHNCYFNEDGHLCVKNLSAFWLPEFTLQKEIGGTVYTVTGSYDGVETLDRKMERIMGEKFTEKMEDSNYVRLIQEWEMNENGCIPWYKYKEASYTSTWYLKESNTIYQSFPLGYNYSKLKYHCYLKLLDSLPVFCGFGVSVKDARMAACKLAYEYLEENDMLPSIRDEIEDPNRDDAINQLEILARRGYFSIPAYDFNETHDDNGNPIWNCECHIAEDACCFDGTSSSKKEAKKDAAFRMLLYVLGMEGK